MLATMMLAPGILIDQAKAQQNRRDRGDGEGRGRDGNRGDRTGDRNGDRTGDTSTDVQNGQRGAVIAERDFGNWDRRYIGRRTFKLIDDQEYGNLASATSTAVKDLQGKTAALDNKEKDLKTAIAAKDAIDKKIGDISKAIVDSLAEQQTLKKGLPQLNRQLKGLKDQQTIAKSAADAQQAKVDRINEKVTKKEAALKKVEDECAATPAADCNAKITAAKDAVAKAKAPLRQQTRLNRVAKDNLSSATEKVKSKEGEIKAAQNKIAKIDTDNAKRSDDLGKEKTKLNAAKAKVTAEQATLKPIRQAYANSLKNHNTLMTRKNRIKEMLITRVMRINGIGSRVGEEAGSIDGDFYAEYVGIPAGQRDGDRDGTNEGTTAGQNSSYQRGLNAGEIQGNSEAEAQGEVDGTKIGTHQGHVAAATTDGNDDGVNRANNSDAANVGTQQGRSAGLQRAKDEGKTTGEALGKKQAIEKNEKGALESSNVDGQFAGAFAAVVPDYPGFNCVRVGSRRYNRDDYGWRGNRNWTPDHQVCPTFRPRKHSEFARTNRPILRQAFMDAYLMSYRHNRRGQFNQSIDRVYLGTYDSSRRAAYEEFSTREYPRYTESGRVDGRNAAYNARYPIVKEEARRVAFANASTNPDTNSGEYRSTYSSVEAAAYADRYEEIRSANFGKEELSTFQANIEEQTEIFRKARYAVVDSIYANNPVLKFVTSSMKDGGISGIAKNDGVFQPGETTLHNVTITNYGKKAATNVTVRLSDGSTAKLPSIPARKTTTVKGAVKGSVDARLGSRFQSTLKAFAPLTAESSIQGRHFYATSNGRLNSGDTKTVGVSYPIALGSLKTKSQLLINQANTLTLNVSNVSKRKYEGSLKIELDVNSSTGIITRNFSDLSELSGSKTIDSAKVLVASERDTFKPLTFTAKIMKQGVTLGTLNGSYTTMAKAPYSEKNGKPVFLADSDKNARDLINALEQVGGLQNASVIDLSLSRMNRDVLSKGVNKKMIVALDDLRGSTQKGVATLLKNSEDTVMLFVDERNAGITLQGNVLRNAAVLPVKLKGNNELFNLRFTNPFVDGVKEMTVVAQTTPRGMVDAMATLKGLMKTNNELVGEAGSALNSNNATTTAAPVQNMIAMAMGEILVVNKAYKASNNDKYEDIIRDNSRIYTRVLDASGKKVKRNTLSKNLAAFTMFKVIDHALDKFDPVDDQMEQAIETEIEDRLRDTIKGTGLFRLGKGLQDNLKKHDKRLYNKIDETPFAQSPMQF